MTNWQEYRNLVRLLKLLDALSQPLAARLITDHLRLEPSAIGDIAADSASDRSPCSSDQFDDKMTVNSLPCHALAAAVLADRSAAELMR